jgi:hypothetical protein
MTDRPTWDALGARATAWRVVHAAWSVAQLAGLGLIWHSAITRRRDRRTAAAVAFLGIEGIGLAIGRGDCPAGRMQQQWGDPVPFFELVLPPRAARAAVPVLLVVSLLGLVLLGLRAPVRTGGPGASGTP